MDEVTRNGGPWVLDHAVGTLRIGGLSARVDVARPHSGMRDVRVGDWNFEGTILCVSREADDEIRTRAAGDHARGWPLAVGETYVRGDDLVASYQPSKEWPYSPQIYWRARSLEGTAGLLGSVELLVSVQTHLLDTFPRIVVTSHIAADDLLYLTVGGERDTGPLVITGEQYVRPTAGIACVVRRIARTTLSYAEFMPASDFRGLRVASGAGECRLQWELFAEFLEKGVIRRARLHSAMLQRENDLELAKACCRAIELDSLPLTT